ncbi:glycosyltransferase [candidate division KSB1 bacterium]|nr:glycosyltransferase [candidate division KSB1 bacterium]
MMSKDSVLITLPVFNEAEFLESVLFEMCRYVSPENILVVDDGSTDGTLEKAANGDWNVISHTSNLGKGKAIQTAITYAIKSGYDWIVTLDGDGQHPPRYIPDFIRFIRGKSDADVIVGNRYDRYKKMPVMRIMSNGITSVIVSLCAGNQRIMDSQCGFRALRLAAIPLQNLQQSGFQFESELLIRIGKAGGRIYSLPIETVYGSERSSIRAVRDTLKFIGLIFNSFFWT